jgi:hypothetical protein
MTKDATRDVGTGGALTPEELAAEEVTALPDKEVVSILDLNVDADIALDLAAPIDLAVAANANVAAPIDAAVGANILSAGSSAQALSDQGVMITQGIVGDSTATATQVSDLDQSGDVVDAGAAPMAADATTAPATDGLVGGAVGDTVDDAGTAVTDGVANVGETVSGIDTGDALSGDVLNVDVNVAADADLAAPIAGAIAANANVAAPIDAAAAANIGSVASNAVAVANQDAIIEQSIEGDSTATSDQDSELSQ